MLCYIYKTHCEHLLVAMWLQSKKYSQTSDKQPVKGILVTNRGCLIYTAGLQADVNYYNLLVHVYNFVHNWLPCLSTYALTKYMWKEEWLLDSRNVNKFNTVFIILQNVF